uniref:Sugar phosphate transporter domain-containing protein n=1 Tax=Pyrodinium bahamense TaxID=73915 RepID=A0A7R9ZX60_9DINO|mmetsp:Transcript_13422/g.37126  ORF Transcript_13422/g.37126 Transcript_13422/m.37126 type:complete len:473 (+) Transcript_13422:110-1528(+)
MIDLYPVKVIFSVVVYCLAVSAVPIYNKEVFSGAAHAGIRLTKFPYPIATAFLQLGLVAVVLSVMNVVGHLTRRESGASWIFGPHFAYKLRVVAPVGLLFGLKYGLTNWGLQLMATGTHLLLQSTDLIWTVVTARLWNQEKLGCVELFAAVLATIGSVMIGLHAGQVLEAPMIPLLVNCLTPLVLALCISTLRSGAKELFRPDNRLQGSVTPAEFTAIKLFLSAFMALLLSFVLESGAINLKAGHRPPWWVALQEESAAEMLFLFVGGVFVLIFQVNITWLSGLTSAVTVGIVGGIKVVPQWLLNAAFLGMHINTALLNIGGAMLVLSASIIYAVSICQPNTLTFGRRGFEWKPRDMLEDDKDEPLLACEEDDEPTPLTTPTRRQGSKQRTGSKTRPGAEQRSRLVSEGSESLITLESALEVSLFLETDEDDTMEAVGSRRSSAPARAMTSTRSSGPRTSWLVTMKPWKSSA